jgi:hypothetical protein
MTSQYSDGFDDEERRKASIMVTTMLERQEKMKGMDPFLLLKEVTESIKFDPEQDQTR